MRRPFSGSRQAPPRRAICKPPKVQGTIMPERAAVDSYRVAFQRYRALYPAIKEALKS